ASVTQSFDAVNQSGFPAGLEVDVVVGAATVTLVVSGDMVAVPEEAGGAMRTPQAFLVAPNPLLRGLSEILFEVPSGARSIDVAIYDATGRRVRSLASGRLEPGRMRLTWDGREPSGRPVASGIYFVRLAIDGGAVETRRLVVVR
ncbi:MAG: FlgD immunoglobulin-like domain containing protein, partial [Candidatus Eiseniibacteriota bacterium]